MQFFKAPIYFFNVLNLFDKIKFFVNKKLQFGNKFQPLTNSRICINPRLLGLGCVK